MPVPAAGSSLSGPTSKRNCNRPDSRTAGRSSEAAFTCQPRLRAASGCRKSSWMVTPGTPLWFQRLRLKRALKRDARVAALGERLLGRQQWSLLRSYGRCVGGPPFGGLYVSGMPAHEVERLLNVLAAGGTARIHLMHRHHSGHQERSSLRLGPDGALVMVYPDREVPALPRPR